MRYFPIATKVKPLTRIRRQRILPRPGEVVVRSGQQVNPVHVLARSTQGRGFQIVRASELLDVAPEELEQYMLVEEGAVIKRGLPLFGKPGRFGRSKRFGSPIDGILYLVRNGNVVLQQEPEPFELRAMMHGRVLTVVPNRGAVIETDGSLIESVWDSGRAGYGKLVMLSDSGEDVLTEDRIGMEHRGAILAAGRVERLAVLERLELNGVRGLIVGSMPAALVQQARESSYPVQFTDGIGYKPMAEPIFQLLKDSEGREASLFPRDESSRTERAEIVIPLPTMHVIQPDAAPGEPLAVGKQVRVLKMMGRTRIGRVSALYPNGRKTVPGLKAPGATVEFSNGETQFVPLTNLDLII